MLEFSKLVDCNLSQGTTNSLWHSSTSSPISIRTSSLKPYPNKSTYTSSLLSCEITILKKESLLGITGLITLLHVCISSMSVAGQNPICRPSSCGDMMTISDPFRLKGDPAGCGDLRYELACEKNRTVLNLYRGKYYVEEINYQDYTIRVVDPGLKKGDCLSTPLYHLTPANFSYGDPYEWPYYWKFRTTALMSCSSLINDNDKFIPITPCNSTNGGNSSSSSHPYHYAMSGNGDSLQVGNLPASCIVGKSIFSELGPDSESGNRSMWSLQDQLLLGVELSFLQIRCIRECRVKGENCFMEYSVNSVKCDDPDACKYWLDCVPIWVRALIIILGLIFYSIYTPIIAGGIIVRAILGAVLCVVIYKLRLRHISKHDDTAKDIP